MNVNTPVANIFGSKATSILGIAYAVLGGIVPMIQTGATVAEALPAFVVGLMGLFAKN